MSNMRYEIGNVWVDNSFVDSIDQYGKVPDGREARVYMIVGEDPDSAQDLIVQQYNVAKERFSPVPDDVARMTRDELRAGAKYGGKFGGSIGMRGEAAGARAARQVMIETAGTNMVSQMMFVARQHVADRAGRSRGPAAATRMFKEYFPHLIEQRSPDLKAFEKLARIAASANTDVWSDNLKEIFFGKEHGKWIDNLHNADPTNLDFMMRRLANEGKDAGLFGIMGQMSSLGLAPDASMVEAVFATPSRTAQYQKTQKLMLELSQNLAEEARTITTRRIAQLQGARTGGFAVKDLLQLQREHLRYGIRTGAYPAGQKEAILRKLKDLDVLVGDVRRKMTALTPEAEAAIKDLVGLRADVSRLIDKSYDNRLADRVLGSTVDNRLARVARIGSESSMALFSDVTRPITINQAQLAGQTLARRMGILARPELRPGTVVDIVGAVRGAIPGQPYRVQRVGGETVLRPLRYFQPDFATAQDVTRHFMETDIARQQVLLNKMLGLDEGEFAFFYRPKGTRANDGVTRLMMRKKAVGRKGFEWVSRTVRKPTPNMPAPRGVKKVVADGAQYYLGPGITGGNVQDTADMMLDKRAKKVSREPRFEWVDEPGAPSFKRMEEVDIIKAYRETERLGMVYEGAVPEASKLQGIIASARDARFVRVGEEAVPILRDALEKAGHGRYTEFLELLKHGLVPMETGADFTTAVKMLKQLYVEQDVMLKAEAKDAVVDLRKGLETALAESVERNNFSRISGEVAADVADIITMHARLDQKYKKVLGVTPFEGLDFLYDRDAGHAQIKLRDDRVARIAIENSDEIRKISIAEAVSGVIRPRVVQDVITQTPIGPDSQYFASLAEQQVGEGFLTQGERIRVLNDTGAEASLSMKVALSRVNKAVPPGDALTPASLMGLWQSTPEETYGLRNMRTIEGYRYVDEDVLAKLLDTRLTPEQMKDNILAIARAAGVKADEKRIAQELAGLQGIDDVTRDLVVKRFFEAQEVGQEMRGEVWNILLDYNQKAAKALTIEKAAETAAQSLTSPGAGAIVGTDKTLMEDVARVFAEVNPSKKWQPMIDASKSVHPAGIFSKEFLVAEEASLAILGAERSELLKESLKYRMRRLGLRSFGEATAHAAQIMKGLSFTEDQVAKFMDLMEVGDHMTDEALEAVMGATTARRWNIEPIMELGLGEQAYILPLRSKAMLHESLRNIHESIGLDPLIRMMERQAGEDFGNLFRANLFAKIDPLRLPRPQDLVQEFNEISREIAPVLKPLATGEIPFSDVDPVLLNRMNKFVNTYAGDIKPSRVRTALATVVSIKAHTGELKPSTYAYIDPSSKFFSTPYSELSDATKVINNYVQALDAVSPGASPLPVWTSSNLVGATVEEKKRFAFLLGEQGKERVFHKWKVRDALNTVNKVYANKFFGPVQDQAAALEQYLSHMTGASPDILAGVGADFFRDPSELSAAQVSRVREVLERVIIPTGKHTGRRIGDFVYEEGGQRFLTDEGRRVLAQLRRSIDQGRDDLAGFSQIIARYAKPDMANIPFGEGLSVRGASQVGGVAKDVVEAVDSSVAAHVATRDIEREVTEAIAKTKKPLTPLGILGIAAAGAYAGYRMFTDPLEQDHKPQGFRRSFPLRGGIHRPSPDLRIPVENPRLQKARVMVDINASGIESDEQANTLQNALQAAVAEEVPFPVNRELEEENDEQARDLNRFGKMVLANRIANERPMLSRWTL